MSEHFPNSLEHHRQTAVERAAAALKRHNGKVGSASNAMLNHAKSVPNLERSFVWCGIAWAIEQAEKQTD